MAGWFAASISQTPETGRHTKDGESSGRQMAPARGAGLPRTGMRSAELHGRAAPAARQRSDLLPLGDDGRVDGTAQLCDASRCAFVAGDGRTARGLDAFA